jgi:hypothetical protein
VEHDVRKLIGLAATVAAVSFAGGVAGQGMLLDFMGDRVIAKFQTSTCAELKAKRDEPKSDKEKAALDFLRHDTQARVAFIDKIAAPVANKMFECDMFP